MKKLIAFDLDDTLATTKSPMTAEMADLLVELAGLYEVCIITGGLYKQIEENVIANLYTTPSRLEHMHFMPVNGAQYHHYSTENDKWQHDQFVSDLPVSDKTHISQVIERVAKELGYWEDAPAGPIIADRGTQITYSALGQYAKAEDKYSWDPDRTKRVKMHEIVAAELPGFEVRINGNTSIDVMRPGIDKGYGIEKLRTKLKLKRDEVLFIGDQLQEDGNDYPVKVLGIDTIAVENIQETALIIKGLVADRRKNLKSSAYPWGDVPLPEGLDEIITHLIALHVSSREDMKQQVSEVLEPYQLKVLDTHNTAAIIFRFRAGKKEYGLKIEYGAADPVRNEIHWYEHMPVDLKPHHVMSHLSSNYAFILLKWLSHARTLEDVAAAGDENTMDLVIQALDQDKKLFESNPTVLLDTSRGSSFFFDKYHSYNAAASKYPYLQELLDCDRVRVNGKELAGPYKYVQRVQQDDDLRTYLSPDRAGLIHGDSHAGNLLVENNRVYLIDPKGIDHLPLEYDTGRVYWSLSGWNAIVRGEFTLKEKDGTYQLDIVRRQRYLDGLPRFRSLFSDQDYHRAVYSAAMQYLTRVSHGANKEETLALYLRGLQIFEELFAELKIKP